MIQRSTGFRCVKTGLGAARSLPPKALTLTDEVSHPLPAFLDSQLYVSTFQRPISDRLGGDFFSDPAQTAVTCVRTGPVSLATSIDESDVGEEVFAEARSLLFKCAAPSVPPHRSRHPAPCSLRLRPDPEGFIWIADCRCQLSLPAVAAGCHCWPTPRPSLPMLMLSISEPRYFSRLPRAGPSMCGGFMTRRRERSCTCRTRHDW